MLQMSEWANQDESNSSGRELLAISYPSRFRFPISYPSRFPPPRPAFRPPSRFPPPRFLEQLHSRHAAIQDVKNHSTWSDPRCSWHRRTIIQNSPSCQYVPVPLSVPPSRFPSPRPAFRPPAPVGIISVDATLPELVERDSLADSARHRYPGVGSPVFFKAKTKANCRNHSCPLSKVDVMSTTKANLAQRVKYFEAVMSAKLELIREKYRHSGNKGSGVEQEVRAFLREWFPRTYQIGHGEVIDTNGLISGQLDVVVTNEHHPSIQEEAGAAQFMIEGVACAAEVKTTLTSRRSSGKEDSRKLETFQMEPCG